MGTHIHEFDAYRSKMNDRILATGNVGIKRFFNLDSAAYQDGALPAKTKELLGLCASTVLRCNDCITYHVIQCKKLGVTQAEFDETMNIALVVGGSITIPHVRKAYEVWDEAGFEK
ncbi:MAG: carboxymuconolactone decarboxylase family protein [Candidatus Edwardsbacteria bacterium]|jgi:AhpD family alkylhydroperoxidase|nr:carboxymuconolactone decarboxylase family protein [Candidatus Edwardsbacteria bacterium]